MYIHVHYNEKGGLVDEKALDSQYIICHLYGSIFGAFIK